MAKKGFQFSDDYYTVEGAQTLLRENPKALRKEYTRMRDIAQKRIKRLEQEYGWTKTYKEHKEGFRTLAELDNRNIAKAFSELSKFVRARGSTVSGQRKMEVKTSGTLNKAVGNSGAVNHQNYKRVIDILDEARKQKVTFGSDKIVDLADTFMTLTDKQFDKVLDRLGDLVDKANEQELDAGELLDYELEEYMAERNIKSKRRVNMNAFLKELLGDPAIDVTEE